MEAGAVVSFGPEAEPLAKWTGPSPGPVLLSRAARMYGRSSSDRVESLGPASVLGELSWSVGLLRSIPVKPWRSPPPHGRVLVCNVRDVRLRAHVSLSVVSNSWRPHRHIPPGSSVHGIFQARTLEWVAIFLFQGIFSTWVEPAPLGSPASQADSLLAEPSGKPVAMGLCDCLASACLGHGLQGGRD